MYLKKSALRLPLHLPPILCSFYTHKRASFLSALLHCCIGRALQWLQCVYVFRSSSRTFFFVPLTLVLLPACLTSCFCRSPFSSKTNSRSLAAQPVDIHTHSLLVLSCPVLCIHTHKHTHTHSLTHSVVVLDHHHHHHHHRATLVAVITEKPSVPLPFSCFKSPYLIPFSTT